MSPEKRNQSDQVYEWLVKAHRERAEQFLRGKFNVVSGEMRVAAAEIGERLRVAADSAERFLRRASKYARRVEREETSADAAGAAGTRQAIGRFDQARADVSDVIRTPRDESSVLETERAAARGETANVSQETDIRNVDQSELPKGLVLPQDPAEMNRLWSTLSREDKLTMWSKYRSLGNHDGIPHEDRNILNRLTLKNMREDAVAARSAGLAAGDAEKVVQMDKRIADLDRVGKAIGNADDRVLIYLDKDLNTVVSDTNMDLADLKVTYVVGAGSGPIGSAAMADKLSQAARRVDENANVATARWQAYRRPDGGDEIRMPKFAEDAAPALRRFQEGLLVTHVGDTTPVLTGIGHSYGARVLGEAARFDRVGEAGFHADNLAFTGSFGTGVDNVDGFKLAGRSRSLNTGRVFATMKEHDPFNKWTSEHGRKPTDPAFHASVFPSPSEPGSWLKLRMNADEHWKYYYEDGSTDSVVLNTLGKIITNQARVPYQGGK